MAKTGIITEGSVQVRGLKELNRALRDVSKELPKELTKVNKDVVNRVVVPKARAKAAAFSRRNLAGGTARVGSKGAKSIRSAASATAARVIAGGNRAPWFPGDEFGALGTRRHTRQFPPVARPGNMLWPVILDAREQVMGEYVSAIDELMARALPH